MKGLKPVNCSLKSKVLSSVVLTAALAAGFYVAVQTQSAQAKGPLGQNWPASQRLSMDEIDHSALDALLKKYVDSDGYVNYAAWNNSSSDRRALQNYLMSLSRASRQKPASRQARLAFWINAYNAVTLEGILREYPTDSIRNHTSKLGGYNIWDDLPLLVGGESYSLNNMEHKILRKMNEPRIHFAIVCASVGCPRLRNEAYTPESLEQQLADNARDFFSRAKNLRIDRSSGTLYLSSILKWFGEDFGATLSQRLQTLMPFFPESAQAALVGSKIQDVEYLDYNWSLNDQRRKRTARR